ncbi:MAG: ABC transporter ATP-binding protein [Hyphomicrobiales bacterium]
METDARAAAIELKGINKRFGAVHANRDISLSVGRGTIHGIVGENGAGKSTLMSILYGFYRADSGEIRINGAPVDIATPDDAIAHGIGMVHQHFMLVDPFTVLENVVLGAEGGLTLTAGIEKARTALTTLEQDYGLEVPLDAPVETLTVGQQQRVEILKALFRGADILILDEPTGVLTPPEADHLFRILRQLKEQGKTIILITHKLREILAITDNVSVMRRGEMVDTLATSDASAEKLAELMVGRRVLLRVNKTEAKPGRTVLEVQNLTVVDSSGVVRVDDASFTVRAGEIVGIAGVAGNGQSELLEALAGMRPFARGSVSINGTAADAKAPDAAALRDAGMAHVPEDRQRIGLVTRFDACENTLLGHHTYPEYHRGLLLDHGAILNRTRDNMTGFDVRPCDPKLTASLFSGGNQQKLVLAREIERDPDLLIVGQPTRGVDIGAIEFIHRRLVELRDSGKAILLVSVELDEIRALSDRILVMFAGRIVGERDSSAGEGELGLLMAGVTGTEAA